MCVHILNYLHFCTGAFLIFLPFLLLPSLCSGDKGDKSEEKEKKRHCLMEPRAGAPWEWQPLPKIRRETKTGIKAKIKQKQHSERRELIFGSPSFTTPAACLTMLKNRGYIKFIFTSCFCYYSSRFCLGLLFLISFQERRNQLPSDPLRAHDTLKLFPNILNIYGRVWICVHVCAVGKKRGPALLEVVTSLCACSIHPRIKALRVCERARECV